ncbi:hypothetical protein CSC2_30920 [Clostridium zeae]|uniref:Gp28/Gp37-like domain-containing protein n=1 Tax=Clostridium zeae TaxID=2759022 RepID=A0ABQ1ECN9_9CLOT|nr:siphovirus ReqiPepy6 Gp37-like family protein [Clostridium zeae]GFZ32566.1 hypothetical protein CSC2_30920 [Clostridium zeae]
MIKIMDIDFNLLGEIDNFSSLQFTRKYYKYGEFELHLPVKAQDADKLNIGNIIFYDTGRKAGIIEYRELSQEDNENLVVKGYTLGSIINRRITLPPEGQAYDQINAVGETAIKHYVGVNCINSTDVNRNINRLVLEKDLGRGFSVSWQSRFKQLDEDVIGIAQASGLGWDINLDFENEHLIFSVIEGRDLTANQEQNPPVIFSVDFDNVTKQEFTDSNVGSKNFAFVGGKGEGSERKIITVGDNASGFDRVETFVDARDIDNVENLATQGRQKLFELQPVMSFTNEIMNNTFKYQEDWEVGDIVTCQNKEWGITMDTRITEVKEIYEGNESRLEVTFGNSVPTLTDKLKKALDSPIVETASETKYDDRYYTKSEINDKLGEAGVSTYIFTQMTPSAVWNINHNLSKRPSVSIVDSAGSLVVGEVKYVDDNNIKITFSAAFSGYAYIN